MDRNRKKAFTILELLVVIAILAILAVIVMPQFIGAIDKSKDAQNLAEINSVSKAVSLYYTEKGEYPTLQGVQPTYGNPCNIKFDALVPEYLTHMPHFSYWYIDNKGKVYHTQYSLGDKSGSSLIGISEEYVYKVNGIKEEGTTIDLSGGKVVSILDENSQPLPDITIDFMGSMLDPNSPEAKANADANGIKQIAAGYYHSIALLNNGTVKIWGGGSLTPTTVPNLTNVVQVAGGADYTIALLDDGTVKAWGGNGYGQLGLGNQSSTSTPTTIPNLDNVKQIACGQYHTLALLNDGTVKSWGFNSQGALGLGYEGAAVLSPTTIPGLAGVTALEAGETHSLFVIGNDTVKACGYNGFGQIGDNTYGIDRVSPVTSYGVSGATQVNCGYIHSLALLSNGTVMGWGSGRYGQVGTNTYSDTNVTPALASGITNAKQIAAGWLHSIILLNDGKIVGLGYNGYGQLGDGSITTGKQIAVGYNHTLVLLEDGTVKAFGLNGSGQLGDGTTTNSSTPVTVNLQ